MIGTVVLVWGIALGLFVAGVCLGAWLAGQKYGPQKKEEIQNEITGD